MIHSRTRKSFDTAQICNNLENHAGEYYRSVMSELVIYPILLVIILVGSFKFQVIFFFSNLIWIADWAGYNK